MLRVIVAGVVLMYANLVLTLTCVLRVTVTCVALMCARLSFDFSLCVSSYCYLCGIDVC